LRITCDRVCLGALGVASKIATSVSLTRVISAQHADYSVVGSSAMLCGERPCGIPGLCLVLASLLTVVIPARQVAIAIRLAGMHPGARCGRLAQVCCVRLPRKARALRSGPWRLVSSIGARSVCLESFFADGVHRDRNVKMRGVE